MDEDADHGRFMALSCALTGFSRYDLDATGLGRTYLAQAAANLGPDTWKRLLVAGGAADEAAIRNRISEGIMPVPVLRDAARRIILLWYVGSWYLVAPYGADVVSTASYREGLMWKAAATHPMGGAPQGYGSWALPPPAEMEA